MTAKDVYRAILVEMNKTAAPSILLEDFNYLFNKAINQYINKRYNIYDTNEQTTDDLRVLKSTAILTPVLASDTYGTDNAVGSLYGAVYETNLPLDYLHILNCVCVFKTNKAYDCYDKDEYVRMGARRLTADMWSQIIRNFYMQPTYRNPYFYIHNVNSATDLPTNPVTKKDSAADLTLNNSKGTDGELPSSIVIGGNSVNLKDRPQINRYGNSSQVRLEVRYGEDKDVFTLEKVIIDYLKAPQKVRLTQGQIDQVIDSSQVLEFPDYVCQEIINELTKLLLENSSDPRLQTNLAVNQTIASSVQQSQPKK